MSKEKLLRNPVNIGDIFFSGSQSVKKGDEVTWILQDTWAFKATEDCGVSTNASPFVRLRAGQTFIIYKRTQDDIDEGNAKGIYIFDRDTVVALAYPQEVTQDIILENENYNNNVNNIDVVVEAQDKDPRAIISASNAKPIEGETVTISGTGSYFYAPATSLTYKWYMNGVNMGTSNGFSFKATDRQYDIDLTVTDNKGLKNSKRTSIYGQSKPTLKDIVFERTYKPSSYALIDSNRRDIALYTFGKSGAGTITVKATANAWTVNSKVAQRFNVQILINGVVKGSGTALLPANTNQNYVVTATGSFTGSLSASTSIIVRVQDPSGTNTKPIYGGGSLQPDDSLQVTISNRTS